MAKAKTRRSAAKPAPRRAAAARKTARRAPTRRASAPAKPRTITPYLAVNDAAGAIDWYKKVLGAKEINRQPAGAKIMHAALKIGDSDLFLADIFPGSDVPDPARVGAAVTIHVYSKDIDDIWQRATQNGAKVVMPLANQFWGDRYGQFVDPYGHRWALNHPARMTAAEKEKLRQEAMAQMGGGAPPS
jgi:uncharacterized glyoxalase superfamily protein PhnB